MANLITDPSTWGSAVGGPVLKTQLVDPINEWTADTGYITSGIFAAGTGISSVTQIGRVIGNVAWVRVTYVIGTAAGLPITPNTQGDISNVIVLTIADARFQPGGAITDQSLSSSGIGRVAAHSVRTATDDVVLAAVAGAGNIVNGDFFSFTGSYLLD